MQMKANSSHLNSLMLFVVFHLLIQSCLSQLIEEGQQPILKIAFLPDGVSAPPSWQPHEPLNLTGKAIKFLQSTNQSTPAEFQHTIQASSFRYSLVVPASLTEPGKHVIRVGILDPTKDCIEGTRKFRVRANSILSPLTDAKCGQPNYIDISISIFKLLKVIFTSYKSPNYLPPVISNIQIFKQITTSNIQSTPITSVSPSLVPSISLTSLPTNLPPTSTSPSLPTKIIYDAGSSSNDIPKGAAVYTRSKDSINARSLFSKYPIPADSFLTSLQGESFDVTFQLPPGTYDITLGFIETQACNPVNQEQTRIFNVLFNSNVRLESYDIFDSAKGCGKGTFETFPRQIIDSIQSESESQSTSALTISFQAIAGIASISAIYITPSKNQCTPVTTDVNVLDDHLAHAVPGKYPPSGSGASSYIDVDGKGYVDVTINGRGSHTHFSYKGGSGKIISYQWTEVETGKLLSTKAVFRHRFKLGSTRLKLSVIDNACTEDEAEATVTVSGSMQQGMYCYFYTWMNGLPDVNTLDQFPKPKFAATSLRTRIFSFPKFPFYNTRFVTRCQFFLELKKDQPNFKVSIQTGRSGHARVYKGNELVVDSYTSFESNEVEESAGLVPFEIIYQRTNLERNPRIIFKTNGVLPKAVLHDRSTILPIITSVFPGSGIISGGSRIRINGYGLSPHIRVFFGPVVRKPRSTTATTKQIFVTAPRAPNLTTNRLPVFVQTGTGARSNYLSYEYTGSCGNVKFDRDNLKIANAKQHLHQPTSIAMWRDGSLYIGQRDGKVVVIQYDSESYRSTRVCSSKKLIDKRYVTRTGGYSQRSILGITFNPQDIDQPMPYVSVSTLFWRAQKNIDEKLSSAPAWSNGAVVRLKWIDGAITDNSLGTCLTYDKHVISNLPVADSDHSVNDLVFTNEGDLLVSIGGATNMGLPALKLGGKWEAFLSSSVIIAKLSKGKAFNGEIPYTTPDEYLTAQFKPGYTDVQFFVTGTRNLFSFIMARNGKLFGVDMGPNCGFGNASSTCDEFDPSKYVNKRHWIGKTEGKTVVDRRDPDYFNCTRGPGRPDKILQLKRGKFYGHPNLPRGRIQGNNKGQCSYIDPIKNKTWKRKTYPWNYEAPLSMIQSAKTGIVEYGSNLFCGQIRNDLLFSANTENGIWRLKLNKQGQPDGDPFIFQQKGGIKVIENVHGDLLFPSYKSNTNIYIAKPRVKRSGLEIVNVLPYRTARAGGGQIIVGGWGFDAYKSISVWFGVGQAQGEKECPIIDIKRQGTEIWCRTPSFVNGWSRLQNVTIKAVTDDELAEAQQVTLPNAMLYMNI